MNILDSERMNGLKHENLQTKLFKPPQLTNCLLRRASLHTRHGPTAPEHAHTFIFFVRQLSVVVNVLKLGRREINVCV